MSLIVDYNTVVGTQMMKQMMVEEVPIKWLNALLFCDFKIEIPVEAFIKLVSYCVVFLK